MLMIKFVLPISNSDYHIWGLYDKQYISLNMFLYEESPLIMPIAQIGLQRYRSCKPVCIFHIFRLSVFIVDCVPHYFRSHICNKRGGKSLMITVSNKKLVFYVTAMMLMSESYESFYYT